MPTSPFGHIETFIGFLMESRPRSILDIGLGNGKLGFLARDCLDVMLNEAYHRSRWKVRIDGIEAYADYIQDHQRAIYDTIHIGDALGVIDRLGTYDMIILGDVLEHFEKGRAWEFFDKCILHAEHHLAVFIPLGKTWKQPAIYGNSYETHRSSWFFDELASFSERHALFDYSAGPYGAFLVNRDDYVAFRVKRFLTPDTQKDQSQNPLCRRLVPEFCTQLTAMIGGGKFSFTPTDRGREPAALQPGLSLGINQPKVVFNI